MNRAQEWSFVWALADSAAKYMKPEVHVRLCTKIGAGEQKSAIIDLLVICAEKRAALPYELAAQTRAWIKGYAGTDTETILLRLYDQITDRNRLEHGGLRPTVGRDRTARPAR